MTTKGLLSLIFVIAVIAFIGTGIYMDHRGSGHDDYPSCSFLNDRPGTDPDAKCMDGGVETTYRDYVGR